VVGALIFRHFIELVQSKNIMQKDFYNQIDSYLDGDLSGADLAQFEAAMQDKPALAKAVELHRRVAAVMTDRLRNREQDEALKRILEKAGSQYFTEKKPEPAGKRVVMTPLRWATVAACAAVLALLVFMLSPTDLYDDYKLPFPNSDFAEMSDGSDPLTRAGEAFRKKDYPAALGFFDEHLKRQPEDSRALLFRGICLVETGDPAAAVPVFEKVMKGQSVYRADAAWYLALAYVKMKNWAQAIVLLRELAPTQERAGKLLSEVEKKN
jgi:tetratricopeptide (TPR) repeat protein